MTRKEQILEEVARYLYEDFQPSGIITEDRLKVGAHCAMWADEHPQCPWIPLAEQVPPPKERVIFRDIKGRVFFGQGQIDGEHATVQGSKDDIPLLTHWMRIPELY